MKHSIDYLAFFSLGFIVAMALVDWGICVTFLGFTIITAVVIAAIYMVLYVLQD
jgi:hypothetical protein